MQVDEGCAGWASAEPHHRKKCLVQAGLSNDSDIHVMFLLEAAAAVTTIVARSIGHEPLAQFSRTMATRIDDGLPPR